MGLKKRIKKKGRQLAGETGGNCFDSKTKKGGNLSNKN